MKLVDALPTEIQTYFLPTINDGVKYLKKPSLS